MLRNVVDAADDALGCRRCVVDASPGLIRGQMFDQVQVRGYKFDSGSDLGSKVPWQHRRHTNGRAKAAGAPALSYIQI